MTFQGKAIAFIDEANITIQAERLGLRIDYKKLLKYLKENYNLLRAYLYTGVDLEIAGLNNFVVMLRRSGYRVVHYRGDQRKDGSVKANLDVHIAVDMVSMVERYDVAILFSGDGDYVPAIDVISRKGVRVEVISLDDHTANNLVDHADRFTDLQHFIRDNDLIFYNNRSKSSHKPTRDPVMTRSQKLAISLVQDILKGIPESAYPIETSLIAKRAHQLDEKGIIQQTDFKDYSALIKYLVQNRALNTISKGQTDYIASIHPDVVRGMLNGKS